MPVIERQRAFGSPLPELVEGRLQLASQQCKSCLHLRPANMLPGPQVLVDSGEQPAGDDQPSLLVVFLNLSDNLM